MNSNLQRKVSSMYSPRLENHSSQSWQAKKPYVQDLSQLTQQYQVRVAEFVRDAVLSVIPCKGLSPDDRAVKFSDISDALIEKVVRFGLSRNEAVSLLSAVVAGWRQPGLSQPSKVVFQEFKDFLNKLALESTRDTALEDHSHEDTQ